MPRCCSDSRNQRITERRDECHFYTCLQCGKEFIKFYDAEKMKQLGVIIKPNRKHHVRSRCV